ncbi:hypothetical protein [Novipirellula artificiosorum]|uniref:hypothetical protein n=1 Tax=Novipirellula artificiosorum TaxID=2528016 RepID=UPI0011B612AD|nr:hypothetical protein [Novipirellula artificiosorum]
MLWQREVRVADRFAMHSDEPTGDPTMYTNPAMPLDQLEEYFANENKDNERPFCVMATSYYPHVLLDFNNRLS